MYSKPSVTNRPTRAPLPSSTALVATVVPCRIERYLGGRDAGLVANEFHTRRDADRLILRRRRRLGLIGPLGALIVKQQDP